jgi:hypothetical protein
MTLSDAVCITFFGVASLDIFVLMGYDMTSDDAAGDTAGPNSRLDLILKGADAYTQLGIPASKLMLILGWCELTSAALKTAI